MAPTSPDPNAPEFTNRETGEPIEVSPRGSLGLLALGEIGIVAWKKAKQDHEREQA